MALAAASTASQGMAKPDRRHGGHSLHHGPAERKSPAGLCLCGVDSIRTASMSAAWKGDKSTSYKM